MLPADSITELEPVLTTFERERHPLDAWLLKDGRVVDQQRHRVGMLIDDVAECIRHQVIPASLELVAEQSRVDGLLAERFEHYRDPSKPSRRYERAEMLHQTGPYARLRLAFKMAFFAVRALQDELHVCCVILLEGKRPKRDRESMQYGLGHPLTPAGARLGELAGYGEWFAGWRTKRNEVKWGTGFGVFRLGGDVGIHAQKLRGDQAIVVRENSQVGLLDLAEALRQTMRVIELVKHC